jgi:predicted PurR-regulated permease PerM
VSDEQDRTGEEGALEPTSNESRPVTVTEVKTSVPPGGVPLLDDIRSSKVPGWWPKGVMWLVFGALLTVFLFKIWYQIDDFLLTIFLSFFLALALEPVVNFFARRGWRRGLTTLLVFLLTLLGVAGFVAISTVFFIEQAQQLLAILPDAIDTVVKWLNDTFNTEIDATELQQEITDPNGPVRDWLASVAQGALGFAGSAVGSVFQIFTIFLFTFYLVAEGPRFRRTVLSVFKPQTQQTVLYAWEVAIDRTGGYIISRGFLALASAGLSTVFFIIIGLPSPLFLGLFVGVVSQFVPTIGTYIAGALPTLVAIFEGGLWMALAVVIFILIYQQVENYLFTPLITARTVEIHPAVAFGSVMVGAAMLGGIGAIVAIPVAATLQTLLSQLVFARRYDVIDGELLQQPEVEIREAKKAAKGSPLKVVKTAFQASEVRAKTDVIMALEIKARSMEAAAQRAALEGERLLATGTDEAIEAGNAKIAEGRETMAQARSVREEIERERHKLSGEVEDLQEISERDKQ